MHFPSSKAKVLIVTSAPSPAGPGTDLSLARRSDAATGKAVARQILRTEITGLLGHSDWELSRTPRGKPFLASHPALQFSVAHSGGMAVVALADFEVGVDVESLNREISWQMISERYFSSCESEWLRKLGADSGRAAFFDLWLAREAAAKCSGAGLSVILGRSVCAVGDDGVRSISTPLGEYALRFLTVEQEWRIGLATPSANPDVCISRRVADASGIHAVFPMV